MSAKPRSIGNHILFFTIIPGALVSWLYVRKKNSWLHSIIGMILGIVAAYGGLYLFGRLNAEWFAELEYVMGPSGAVKVSNSMGFAALKTAAALILIITFYEKVRRKKSII